MNPKASAHRDTIEVEEAEVLAQQAHPEQQYVIRLRAPRIAETAEPGSFVHLTCDPALAMRRPMSVMRVDRKAGWIQCLYKVVGDGTRLLAARRRGESISVIGPIGRPFRWSSQHRRPLLIGGGVGIPPMVFAAETLRDDERTDWQPFVIMGSEVPFPFRTQPSQIMVDGLPDGVIAAMPLMDEWGIPSRLASLQGYPGVFEGYVTDLARAWLNGLNDGSRAEVEILACGPTPMLRATARLAQEYDLPCQVSLEEYMACAVGGCAGCVVPVKTDDGPAMKRVCVDGPVFDANAVFPPAA